ncbi:MAG: hypothetical protein AAFV98_24815 [Chloroflexota bacterium]
MKAVWMLREHTYKEVSAVTGFSTRRIRQWEQAYDQLQATSHRYEHDEAVYKIAIAQKKMADKIIKLVDALTDDKIDKSPLNQIASALGVVTDRFLRIHDAKQIEDTPNDHPIRIEYYDATTGKVGDAPPWTTTNPDDGQPLHGGFLRTTVRQNGTGETHRDGTGISGNDGLVARTHISDGESRLARPEDDDAERDWHPD